MHVVTRLSRVLSVLLMLCVATRGVGLSLTGEAHTTVRLVHAVCVLLTIIFWLRWVYLLVKHTQPDHPHLETAGRTVIWYFICVVHWFMPVVHLIALDRSPSPTIDEGSS